MAWDDKAPTKEELAKVSWDATPPHPTELANYTPLESVGMGAINQFNAAPIISGAIQAVPTLWNTASLEDTLKKYREARDASKANFKAAEETNPKSYLAGNLVGGIIPAALTGGISTEGAAAQELANLTKATKFIPTISAKTAAGALTGAGYGALTGGLGSESDLTKGEIGGVAKDVLTGGTTGATLGGLVGKIASKFGNPLESGAESLENVANERAVKATGMGKRATQNLLNNDNKANTFAAANATEGQTPEVQNTIQKMGNLLGTKNHYIEEPIVKFGDKTEDVLHKAVEVLPKAGKEIGDSLLEFDKLYNNPDITSKFVNPSEISQTIQEQLLNPLKVDISNPNSETYELAKGAVNTIQKALNDINSFGNNPISFQQSQKLKTLVTNLVNYGSEGSESNQLLKRIGGIINDAIETSADEVANASGNPSMASKYLKAKDYYSTAKQAIEAATGKEAGNLVNRDLGLTDYISGGIGAATHGLGGGAVAAVANKTGKVYGNPAISSITRNSSNTLSAINKRLVDAPKEYIGNIGQKMIQSGGALESMLGPILVKASERDDIGRNALIFSLNQNSGYRELLSKYVGGENEQR